MTGNNSALVGNFVKIRDHRPCGSGNTAFFQIHMSWWVGCPNPKPKKYI